MGTSKMKGQVLSMNTEFNKPMEQEERVGLGVLGAFLFALAGGVCLVLLSLAGYIAALSGIIGVFCAIKGYTLFAKKESTRGIVIACIMTAVVLIIAWYIAVALQLTIDMKADFDAGKADYYVSFGESLLLSIFVIIEVPVLLLDLLLSLLFAALGCGGYVSNMIKRKKAMEAHQAAVAAAKAKAEAQAAQDFAYATDDAYSSNDAEGQS